MSQHILYCKDCQVYSMKDSCPKCDKKTSTTKPAKFSPEDKWGKYRRMAKKEN